MNRAGTVNKLGCSQSPTGQAQDRQVGQEQEPAWAWLQPCWAGAGQTGGVGAEAGGGTGSATASPGRHGTEAERAGDSKLISPHPHPHPGASVVARQWQLLLCRYNDNYNDNINEVLHKSPGTCQHLRKHLTLFLQVVHMSRFSHAQTHFKPLRHLKVVKVPQ